MRLRKIFLFAVLFPAVLTGWLAVGNLSYGELSSATEPGIIIPPEARASGVTIQRVLDRGQELERARRWGEALNHYEEALRDHPDRVEIKRRISKTRIHYDLARRYSDSSYLQTLQNSSEQATLNVYSEMLEKVNRHYVAGPNWKLLVDQGTDHLGVALGDPTFLSLHLPKASIDQLNAFRKELENSLRWRQVRNPRDARSAVAHAARLGWQKVQLRPAATILEYACGLTGALDNYSTYLTPAQLDDVYSQIEGSFVGLGIELKAVNEALQIVKVLPGSPAELGGIHSGDRIVEVDGQSTRVVSTDKAADILKGPEGSTVDLIVVSPAQITRHLVLHRRRVEVPSVEETRMVDHQSGVGYIRLTSFQKTTERDVDAAMWKLHQQGMKSLIVDVRGNPGGLLTASVEVVDKFVSQGTIVSTRGRSAREDYDYKANHANTWQIPLVVLIDRDSASASEIFAAAIHDHRRGLVVGQKSYGKGSVQGIFPLSSSNAGIRLTTAKFYSPSGVPISRNGVSPDVKVQLVAKPVDGSSKSVELSHDLVLEAGIQVARNQLAKR